MHIARPVAEPAGFHFLFAQRSCCGRGGKGMIFPTEHIRHPLSAGRTESLYGTAYGGYVFVLGQDKSDQRLPGLLAEDADPFFLLSKESFSGSMRPRIAA